MHADVVTGCTVDCGPLYFSGNRESQNAYERDDRAIRSSSVRSSQCVRVGQLMRKGHDMENSTLFSHPDVPSSDSSGENSTAPVEHPTFSDRPDAKPSVPQ